ncbi:MAG: hypothetical protein ACFE9Q_12305 [Candidatus Hodarchaeota archaeon]
MGKISLEELVFLENIIDIRANYYVINLKLSKLFKEILKDGKNGIIPILETKMLLHSLINVPFRIENKGLQILKDLTNCMENHWYSSKNTWNCKSIFIQLKKLQNFVLNDYLISGSIVIYNDDYIQWDLNISILTT